MDLVVIIAWLLVLLLRGLFIVVCWCSVDVFALCLLLLLGCCFVICDWILWVCNCLRCGRGLDDADFRFMVALAGLWLCLGFSRVFCLMLRACRLLWLGGWCSICRVGLVRCVLLDACYLLLGS